MMIRTSLISIMREGDKFCRTVAWLVALSILWLSLYPSLLIAKESIDASAARESDEAPIEARLNAALSNLEAEMRKIGAVAEGEPVDEMVWEAIEKLEADMQGIDKEIIAEFEKVGEILEDRELPELIIDRHSAEIDRYRIQLTAVWEDVDRIRNEESSKKRKRWAAEFADRLDSIKKKRSQQHFNPDKLPAKALQPSAQNRPKERAMEFMLADSIGDARQLFASVEGPVPAGQDAFNNPDWLVETDEVEITQSIVDKAAELDNDPVKIYHWVRNNIRWDPNWGAKQTAELTLQLESGNSMDIAGLAIALFRASDIPARYVHGTIDVSEDQFRNWAGGFDDIKAAAQFAANGAIPLTAITSGGAITKVRIEHVWVEVAVDYLPSRGARNQSPDSWIAIDPSYKQYEFFEPPTDSAMSTINTNQIAQDFSNSGTSNDAEGWIAGFDTSVLETAQTELRQATAAEVAATLPDPTFVEVIGDRRTIVFETPTLGSTLVTPIIAVGGRFAAIPSSLQQKVSFALGTSFGQPLNPITLPWSVVNNRKITVGFAPATADDEAAILAYLPAGEIDETTQFPSIPAYLVSVIPELRIDEEVVATGAPLNLGNDIDVWYNTEVVGLGRSHDRSTVIAGSYLAIAAISNGVSRAILEDTSDRTAETSSVLSGGDTTAISSLTREQYLGDVFYAAVLGYYSQYSQLGRIMANARSAQHELAAGLGVIGQEPRVSYVFGIPTSIDVGGVTADLPMQRILGADVDVLGSGKTTTTHRDLNLATGLLGSELEHIVLEQLFDTEPNTPLEAISTVKAIRIAASSGQRIYHITQANQALSLPNINHSPETMEEIRAAIAAGKEVYTHSDSVSVTGFSGAGYVIFDPVTGDGAYKISGGQNGAFLAFVLILFLTLLVSGFLAFATFFSLVMFGVIKTVSVALVGWTAFSTTDAIRKAADQCDFPDFIDALVGILTLGVLGASIKAESEALQLTADLIFEAATKDLNDRIIETACN